ncbi:MAG: hypothetical protein ACC707_08595 [Thiohalomonadales bacterium]
MAKEYLDKLSTFIEKTTTELTDSVELECKHFFSGAALYADGKICLSLTPVGLAIKLPEKTRTLLIDQKKAILLRYFPKAPIKKDYVLFPAGLTKGKSLYKYVKEGIDFVTSKTVIKPKIKPKTSTRKR